MKGELNYKDLPDELYVLGSVKEGHLSMGGEEDLAGNAWFCAWSHKDDCKEFKEKYNYQYSVSLIPRRYLSILLYNANIEQNLPFIISYLYFNPSFSNITFEKTIKDTYDRNVIDVLKFSDYIADIKDDYLDCLNDKEEEEEDKIISFVSEKLKKMTDKISTYADGLEADEELTSNNHNQTTLVKNIINKHISTLAVKQKQLTRFDDYGNEDTSAWEKELHYFIDNVVYAEPSVDASIVGRVEIYGIIHGEIFSYHLEAEVNSDFIENMTGYEYEIFCENILDQKGWNCKLTKSSGDQGVDIIAQKDNVTLAIQCKKYTSPVGNKAVQEVYSGKKFYAANYAIVVSNSTYTQSAKQLANNLNVILAHHDDLRDIEM